jgi:hypothetical protein
MIMLLSWDLLFSSKWFRDNRNHCFICLEGVEYIRDAEHDTSISHFQVTNIMREFAKAPVQRKTS